MKLGDALVFAGVPEHVREPAAERFVTVRMNGGGAVQRQIPSGKTPVPFVGYRVKSGQFIYSRIDARNGAFAIVPTSLDGAVVSKDFPVFDIRRDRVDAGYLNHFFRAGSLQGSLQALSRGATNRQRVDAGRFLQFSIPLPPLDEQRRISNMLDRANLLIQERQKELIAIDEARAGAFYMHFAKAGGGLSLIGAGVLQDWVDAARPITYGILMPGPNVEQGVPYVRVADMRDRQINLDTIRSTTPGIEAAYARSRLRAGDLIMSIRGHVGRFASVPAQLDGANITQDSARISVSDRSRSVYVRAVMESMELQDWMRRHSKGAAVRGINLGDLKNAPVPDADRDTIQKFADLVAVLDTQRAQVQRAIDLHNELFASLQSRAFKGGL